MCILVKLKGSRPNKVVAAVLTTVMVATAFAVLHPWTNQTARVPTPPPTATFGPKFSVTVGLSNSATGNSTFLGNNTTVNVQIFSAVPHSGIAGIEGVNLLNVDPGNNSYYDTLLNATIYNTTNVFFLSPEFLTIAGEWNSLYLHMPGISEPSLEIDAFKTVRTNTSVEIFDYYNNLPYFPANVSDRITESSVNSSSVAAYFNNTYENLSSYSNVKYSNTSFSLVLDFPKHPEQLLNLSDPPSAPITGPSTPPVILASSSTCTPGSSSYTYWGTSSSTYDTNVQTCTTDGILPLVATHITSSTDSGLSEILNSASVIVLNDTIGLNSAQVYESSSGQISSQMSTSPSYEHMANITVGSSINSYGAVPMYISGTGNQSNGDINRTTAYAGIENVTYTFSHFNRYTSDYNVQYKVTRYWRCVWDALLGEYLPQVYRTTTTEVARDLVSTTFDGNGTTGAVSNIYDVNGIQISAGYLPIEVSTVLKDIFESSSNGTFELNTSGSSSSIQASTVWGETYGYSNAANIYGKVSKALKLFSLSMDLGLAIVDVLSALELFPDDTTAQIVTASLKLVSSEIAMTSAVLGEFSTISFLSGTNASIVDYGITNQPVIGPGSNYTLQYYESSYPLTFTENGNAYSFYAPLNYFDATGID